MSVDTGHLGAPSNHRMVWSVLSDLDTEWTVVLEDDATPVPDFRAQLAAALDAAPAPIVSAYLGRLRPPKFQALIGNALAEADSAGAHWITSTTQLLHGVAVAIKTDLVPDLLANFRVMPVDQAIGAWARSRDHRIAYTVPSLVDHADLPTLIQHADLKPRPPGRVAWRVGQRDSWNGKAVTL
jgi:hypothetical protein